MNCVTYPSRQERQKILERRVDLLKKVLPVMASDAVDAVVDRRLNALKVEYGKADMHAVLQYTWRNQAFKEISQHMTENQRKRALYSEYLSSYMRFGGDLPFLSFREYHRALDMNRKIVRELGNGVTMSVETAKFVNSV